MRLGAASAVDAKSTSPSMEGFFAWVHAMERAAAAMAKIEERGFSFLGSDGLPRDEALRFVGEYGAAFQALYRSTAQSGQLAPADGDGALTTSGPERVQINFMGVAGAAGLLPLHYTRLIGSRLKQKDRALADFIDIFNHRLIALFYRAWLKYRLPYQYEQARLTEQTDPITAVLQGLVGDRSDTPMASQLYFAGHFQRACRSAGNLGAMLSALLGTKVDIAQFQGHWVPIDLHDRAMLGARQRLGDGILLGKRYWDISAGITIHVGPFLMQDYKKWLPGSENFALLVRLIDRYVPLNIKINLRFAVIYEPSQEKRLGEGVSLKRTAWLRRSHVDAVEQENSVSNATQLEASRSGTENMAVEKAWVRVANFRVTRGQDVH